MGGMRLRDKLFVAYFAAGCFLGLMGCFAFVFLK